MALAPLFHLPDWAVIGQQLMADGATVRTLLMDSPQASVNALVLNGRADFIEKWADAYTGVSSQGIAIAGWDWRGQGRSTRLVTSGAGHIDSFDRWLDDLDQLGAWALGALPAGRPWIAIAHSMGGHILMRWLADPARASHPLRRQLRGAVLLAPFFGLGLAWPLRMAVLTAARHEVARGHGEYFAPGQGPYGAAHATTARMRVLTASRERFEDEARWIAADPQLAVGGVTWGFLHAFDQSEAALEALPLEQVALPVLMLLASRERLVLNSAAQRIAARLPACDVRVMQDAAHELLREADVPRQQTLALIREFADKQCDEPV